ncbi:MAG: hypothetical protein HFE59_10415 [Clostridiales bacterium]|nr:hypothetical protein [Clostridiales bacterium]
MVYKQCIDRKGPYHSYPRLSQWNLLCLLLPNMANKAVFMTFDDVEILCILADWHVGHFGVFSVPTVWEYRLKASWLG